MNLSFSHEFQLKIIKKIEHRMVDLDMNHAQLCTICDISEGNWSNMRRLQKSLTLEVLIRVATTLDMKIRLSLNPKEETES